MESVDSRNNNSSYTGNKRAEDVTEPKEGVDRSNNNSSYAGNKVLHAYTSEFVFLG